LPVAIGGSAPGVSAPSGSTGLTDADLLPSPLLNTAAPVTSKGSGAASIDTYTQGYNDWLNNQSLPTRVTSGIVEQYQGGNPALGTSGSWVPVPAQDAGQQYQNLINQESAATKAFTGNAVAGAGAGAAVSYLSSETAKTDEITRQFKDFLARVNEVYSTEKANQDMGIAADNQAQKDAEALNQGNNVPVGGAFSVSPTWGQPNYSAELAQSIPTSVSPDYQLNGAVGLPGQDGFAASPMTGSVPSFATGTMPLPQSSLPNGRDMIIRTQAILAKWPYGTRPLR